MRHLVKIAGTITGLVLMAAPSLALAVDTWHLNINRGGSETTYDLDDPATGEMHVLSFDIHTGFYQWLNPNLFKAYILDPYGFVSTSTLNSNVGTLQSQINSLSSQLGGFSPFSISSFMANQASTSQYLASSTFNGFMSGWMFSKLAALSTSTPITATSTRSITTGTGATGFQVSSTRDSTVRYSVKVVTTATIGSPSEGYVLLEVASTNSANANDWVEYGRCGNSQNITLAALLSSVQGTVCQINADVPTGYYAKLRSLTVSGSPTYSYVSGVETLK